MAVVHPDGVESSSAADTSKVLTIFRLAGE
jgi:hypothetical protein